MVQPINVNRAVWLNYVPAPHRDIRNIYPEFPNEAATEQERETRIAILETGGRSSTDIAAVLKDAQAFEPALVGCCPLSARQFQIWFVDRALYLHQRLARRGVPYTLFDPAEAVDEGQLHTIDWRRQHARLRKRIERILGEQVVVIGMGEVEWNDRRQKWQPHYHLNIYGAKNAGLQALREKHYPAKRTGPKPMRRSERGDPAKWFSYMSKLVAFGKVEEAYGAPRRVRLNGRLSREHFRYLAERSSTSFVFCVNCSVLNRRLLAIDDDAPPLHRAASRASHFELVRLAARQEVYRGDRGPRDASHHLGIVMRRRGIGRMTKDENSLVNDDEEYFGDQISEVKRRFPGLRPLVRS